MTRAAQNRALRQDALREQLSKQKHIEQVIENVKKLEELPSDFNPTQAQALKTATELRLKLINKYLPDLKSTEITGEGGGELLIGEVKRIIVDSKRDDSGTEDTDR